MSNRELIQLINEYQSGNMKNFDLLYEVFKRLIYMYAGKNGGEEAVQDLNEFFVELLFKIDLSRFQKDSSDSLKRYIAVSIRNEHNLICKKHQEHLPLNEELIGTLHTCTQGSAHRGCTQGTVLCVVKLSRNVKADPCQSTYLPYNTENRPLIDCITLTNLTLAILLTLKFLSLSNITILSVRSSFLSS